MTVHIVSPSTLVTDFTNRNWHKHFRSCLHRSTAAMKQTATSWPSRIHNLMPDLLHSCPSFRFYYRSHDRLSERLHTSEYHLICKQWQWIELFMNYSHCLLTWLAQHPPNSDITKQQGNAMPYTKAKHWFPIVRAAKCLNQTEKIHWLNEHRLWTFSLPRA